MVKVLASTLLYILISFAECLHHNSYPLKDDRVPDYIEQLKAHKHPEKDPINYYTFTYLSNPKCNIEKYFEDPVLRLTLIVKSTVYDFEKRNAIRSTWGQEYRTGFPEVDIRTVFNLGYSKYKYIQDKVEVESDVFGDILQSDFQDAYFNNTFKTVMGIKWAMENCHSSNFFFFVDEDFFVSTKNLANFLLSQKDEYEKESVYMGYVHKNPKPYRNTKNKWFVSEEEYPFTTYPPFAAGGGVIFSKKGLQDIHYGISYTQHFRLDDVFIGLVAAKANIKPRHNPEIHSYRKVEPKENVEHFRDVIASHGFGDIDEMINVWNQCERAGFA
ncbi:B3GALT1 family protein [Megaselia abdita]